MGMTKKEILPEGDFINIKEEYYKLKEVCRMQAKEIRCLEDINRAYEATIKTSGSRELDILRENRQLRREVERNSIIPPNAETEGTQKSGGCRIVRLY